MTSRSRNRTMHPSQTRDARFRRSEPHGLDAHARGWSVRSQSAPHPAGDAPQADPATAFTLRRLVLLLIASAAATASLLLLLPALADLPDTWSRIADGDMRWLLLALLLEAVSFLGHAVLLRAVTRDAATPGAAPVGLRASTEITLAGHAATRLVASGGAGGVALTAWALRRSGLERRDVATRMTTFIVLLYGVYMIALILGGVAFFAGALPAGAPAAVVLASATLGALVIAVALSTPLLATHLEGRTGRVARRAAGPVAAVSDGVRHSLRLAARADIGLLGAFLWWAGDIAVLWACFQAFGIAPAVTVVVLAYFVGMFANLLPLPGGIGGVDGGMIGALVAFGVDPALSVVAVLAYRGFAFWLPILPGVGAWFGLRRTVAGWERERSAPPAPTGRAKADEALEPVAPDAHPSPCLPRRAPLGVPAPA